MNLNALFNIEDNITFEETNRILNNILYFQVFLNVTDLDICSGDFYKLNYKGKKQKLSEIDLDIEKKLRTEIITLTNVESEEYKKQESRFNQYLNIINSAKNTMLEKVDDRFIKGIVSHILLDHQKKELFSTGSVDFSLGKARSNYRGNCSFVELGEGKVGVFFTIRKLKKTPFTLKDMGVTESMLAKFNMPNGLILISGPTGSAKSSTLNAILDYYNKNKALKIVTLEDPVEFFWAELQKKATFRQREIGKTVKSFGDGIRAAMRQGPDIIVVGELRDRESIQMAIEAASTGHLVISTVHVNSCVQVLDRLLGFFEGGDKQDVANKLTTSLQFVTNQRLIVTEKGEYKVAYEWLDPSDDGISTLIKSNNLQDMKRKMYEVNSDGKGMHKPLNESLFEFIVKGDLPYTKALNNYSNDSKSFEGQFSSFKDTYCQLNGISSQELQKEMLIVEETYKNNKEEGII